MRVEGADGRELRGESAGVEPAGAGGFFGSLQASIVSGGVIGEQVLSIAGDGADDAEDGRRGARAAGDSGAIADHAGGGVVDDPLGLHLATRVSRGPAVEVPASAPGPAAGMDGGRAHDGGGAARGRAGSGASDGAARGEAADAGAGERGGATRGAVSAGAAGGAPVAGSGAEALNVAGATAVRAVPARTGGATGGGAGAAVGGVVGGAVGRGLAAGGERVEARTVRARGEGAGLLKSERAAAVEEVQRALAQVLHREGGTLKVRLQPKFLGSVVVELTLRDGTASALIRAESESARELLGSSLGELRSALEARGVRVERLVVEPLGAGPASQDAAGAGPGSGVGAELGAGDRRGARSGEDSPGRGGGTDAPGRGENADGSIGGAIDGDASGSADEGSGGWGARREAGVPLREAGAEAPGAGVVGDGAAGVAGSPGIWRLSATADGLWLRLDAVA